MKYNVKKKWISCLGSSSLLNRLLHSYQWVLLLLVSDVDVVPQPVHLLLLIAQATLHQLQFLPQLSGVESVCAHVTVRALQLRTECHQVVVELLDLWVETKNEICVYCQVR